MAEEKTKTEKKATTKTTTKKKTTTKAKVEVKEKVKDEPSMITDFSNISPELMQQMFAMFQAMQSQNATIENKEEVKTQNEKPKKITKSYLRTIRDREIVVRSVYGPMIFKSPKTNITYKWTEKGDEEILTIDEILAMESRSTRFLHTPWLMVDDEEVIEGLGLGSLYNIVNKIENIDELLDMDIYDIEALVEKAPYEYKKTLAGEIFAKVDSDEIRDIVLIRELERILGVTLLL